MSEETKTEIRKEEAQRVYTFCKIRRDQASVVWDPKKNSCLAEFDRRGIFRTESAAVAKELRKLGYYEVPVGQRPRPTPMAEPVPLQWDDE